MTITEKSLQTAAGMRAAVLQIDSVTRTAAETVAEMKRAIDDSGINDVNVKAMLDDLASLRQDLGEAKHAAKLAGLDQRASGPESNVERYFEKNAKGDDVLVLRGYHTDETGYVPGLLDDAPCFEQQRELQAAIDDMMLVRECMAVEHKGGFRYRETPQSRARVERALATLPPRVREAIEAKAFVDVTGEGGDWITAGELTTLERDEYRISDVEGLFEETSIPRKSMTLPYVGNGVIPYIKARAQGDNPANFKTSTLSTDERTMTAEGFAVHLQVDEDAAEDAYIAVIPLLRERGGEGLGDGFADGLINGNDGLASAHPDKLDGWTAEGLWPATIGGGNDDHRTGFTGLRHRARGIAGANFDIGSDQDFAGYLSMRTKLDRPYRTRRNELVYLVNDEHYLTKMLTLDEVKTVEKYGNGATVLTGELARLQGIPIVPVGLLTGDLNASGVYDAVTTTKTGILLVARSRVRRVLRKGRRVEVAREIRNGMTSIVFTSRRGLYFMGGSSEKNVIWGYNADK